MAHVIFTAEDQKLLEKIRSDFRGEFARWKNDVKVVSGVSSRWASITPAVLDELSPMLEDHLVDVAKTRLIREAVTEFVKEAGNESLSAFAKADDAFNDVVSHSERSRPIFGLMSLHGPLGQIVDDFYVWLDRQMDERVLASWS